MIRLVTPAGVVTTVAGTYSGVSGYCDTTQPRFSSHAGAWDGVGTSAKIWTPSPMVMHPSGSYAVLADGANLIRNVTTDTYTVSTFAGICANYYMRTGYPTYMYNAASYSSNGDVNTAYTSGGPTLGYVNALAFDSTGSTLYFADTSNYAIRKISGNVVSQVIANTIPNAYGMAVDSSGNVYVSTSSSALSTYPNGLATTCGATNCDVIFKITPGGSASVFAGSGTAGYLDATGTSAQFKYPWGMTFDGNGNLLVVRNLCVSARCHGVRSACGCQREPCGSAL